MAKELPYFKFEPSEWENGTIQMCSRESKGLFIDLCSIYWSRLGELPYALALQKLCNGNKDALQELINIKIIAVEEGQIIIEFLDEQLNEFQETSEKRRKAANKRWSDASAMHLQSKSNAIREEKRREEEIRKEKSKEKKKVDFPWNTQNFISVWGDWKKYKKDQHRFTYKSTSTEQAALTELNKLAADELTAIQIIHQSIGNGWKGFFELKNSNNGRQKNNGSELQETIRNSDLYKSL